MASSVTGGPAIPTVHFVQNGTDIESTFFPDRVVVAVTGLQPHAHATLNATMPGYAANADFDADDQGSIDTSVAAPLLGTYDEADLDGFFWSMVAKGTPPTGTSDIDVTIDVEVGGTSVATRKLHRLPEAEDNVTTDVTDEGLVGVFVTPKAAGPHPAILAFGGSEGGLSGGKG